MSAAIDWEALETPLRPEPRFLVEAPDGDRAWAEIDRQGCFMSLMHMQAPGVEVRALPNAGKRNPAKARQEGIKAGLLDVGCWWNRGHAVVEFKGYDKRGQAGKLDDNQIEFGNRLHDAGHHVACFFRPTSALAWLASLGAPVRPVR